VAARGDMATVLHNEISCEFQVDAMISTIRRPVPLQVGGRPGVLRLVVGEGRGTRGLLDATYSGYRAASAV
jgi:hypothetical protein